MTKHFVNTLRREGDAHSKRRNLSIEIPHEIELDDQVNSHQDARGTLSRRYQQQTDNCTAVYSCLIDETKPSMSSELDIVPSPSVVSVDYNSPLTKRNSQNAEYIDNDDSLTEDMSSVSSMEPIPMRSQRTSDSSLNGPYTFEGHRQRLRHSDSLGRDSSPTGVDDFSLESQNKDPESKRQHKKRSSKSALAKRLAFRSPRHKDRHDRSIYDVGKHDGARLPTYQIMVSLSFAFVVLLTFIYSALSKIAQEITETASVDPMHPKLEVADLVDKRFKLLEKRLAAKNKYQRPTILDALAHKHQERDTKVASPSVADEKAKALAEFLGTTKPLNEITYHDLDFKTKTKGPESCSAPLSPEDVAFTLVTQVSEDRLWMLTQHCQRWPGPISAAVFTDLPASQIETAITQDSRAYGQCKHGQVKIQTFSKSKFPAEDYPVNILRNIALRGIATSHFFYADIDFWASDDLYESLHTDFMKQQLSSDHKMALVVPAFQMTRACKEERECRAENMSKMPHDKRQLMHLVQERKASAFDPTNRGGHGSTSYGEWVHMAHGDLWDIPCILSNRYEPYIAARYCAEFPPYQELFTGYGKNKMTHIMQLRHSGYVFSQVGGVFVIHYPHLSSATRKAWNRGKKQHDQLKEQEASSGTAIDWTQFKRGQVDKVFVEFRRWLEAEVTDEARVPMCPDALNDDEKLWV